MRIELRLESSHPHPELLCQVIRKEVGAHIEGIKVTRPEAEGSYQLFVSAEPLKTGRSFEVVLFRSEGARFFVDADLIRHIVDVAEWLYPITDEQELRGYLS